MVEDDGDTRAFMQAFLGGSYEVGLASSGEEMKSRLEERRANLVLWC